MATLSIIVAMSSNRVIGINNTLPWHLTEDLKRFKLLTTGHTIIMGRKTYESIGKALPNRRNIVISRNKNISYEGVELVSSLDEAFSLSANDDEVFFIGGSNIYEQTLSAVQYLYITEIKKNFVGDAFFPEIDKAIWIESSRQDLVESDELNFSFINYKRKVI
ncbi:MAG: dihydrofolate reductase [Candidatus Methylopumilus sp.]|nr:dihydrofolate reductase [Candidatus Methylopumilus sp.]